MSQNLANLIVYSDMTLKTPKSTIRKNQYRHGSCHDVIFSRSEIRKIRIVSSTVSAHELVYAVMGDEAVKHNDKIRDYQKSEQPENSVGALFI